MGTGGGAARGGGGGVEGLWDRAGWSKRRVGGKYNFLGGDVEFGVHTGGCMQAIYRPVTKERERELCWERERREGCKWIVRGY